MLKRIRSSSALIVGVSTVGFVYGLKTVAYADSVPNHYLKRLKGLQYSTHVSDQTVHVSTMPCNDPFEDRHVVYSHDPKKSYIGVFDGHSGYRCADFVSKSLHTFVDEKLTSKMKPKDAVAQIKKAFLECDDFITQLKVGLSSETDASAVTPEQAQHLIDRAVSGACACLAICDENGVYVANTGDCRAVLGYKKGEKWSARDLSIDQTADNPNEVERIQKLHPGEESTCVYRGRVLGRLQPSRSFGDSRYKWDAAVTSKLPVRPAPRECKTPPYVTAEPDVSLTTFQQDERKNHILILATDGIWDVLSSDMAVKIASRAIENPQQGLNPASAITEAALNVYAADASCSIDGLLAMDSKRARRYRDDITCIVVQLGKPSNEPLNPQGS